MSTIAITFEDFLAGAAGFTESRTALPETLPTVQWAGDRVQGGALEFPELYALGGAVEGFENLVRFEGVRHDLIREIRSDMCTREQAVAYLQNFERHLVREFQG